MKKILFRVFAVSLIASSSGGALAQENGNENGNDDDDSLIEEIIVTSDRRDRAIMDVSQSIQAVPEAVLERPTFNEMSDVMNLVPGATSFTGKQPAKEGMQFRGSGVIQAGAADGQSPVGYYVDDVPFVDIATPGLPPLGTFDLKRIEILRGPQGTSYGQDSTAGSVIMRTNPVDLSSFGYKVRTGLSETKGVDGTGYEIGGVLNMPLAEDVFGIRLSYLREEDPGYGRVEGRPDIKNPLETSRDTLRVKAMWQITDSIDVELTHSEWNTDYSTLAGTQILDSTDGEMILEPVTVDLLLDAYPGGELENIYETSWSTMLINFDLGWAELTSSTGLVDAPRKEANSEFIFDIGLGPQKQAVISNAPTETFTQELRLVSTTDSNLQWLAGLYYMDAESAAETLSEIPDFFVYIRTSEPADTEVQAVYGELEYAFNDRWSMMAGLRYHDEDRVAGYVEDIGFIGVDDPYGEYSLPGEEEVLKNSFDYTNYRLGVTYRPNDDGMIYLTNSRVNRAPILQTEAQQAALRAAGLTSSNDLKPAELDNTELGVKWTLAGGRLQLEAAYVLADWKEIPLWADVVVPGQAPVAMAIPGTDGEVTTTELALTWAATDDLTLTYAGAFTDSEVTKTPPPGSVEGYPPVIEKGGELYNYSPETHNFGLNYSRPTRGDWAMYVSANYVTRDKPDGFNVFLDPDGYIPAADRFENLAISAGVTNGPWGFSFSVANATDHDGQYLPRTAAGGSDAQLFGLIQQPTTYSIQVTYDGMQ